MATSSSILERRPKRRKRVLLGGIVVSADGSHSFNCSIRDVSETGGRILLNGQQVPSQFYLIEVRDRVAHEAKVIWENEKEVGVSFENTFRLADITDPAKYFLSQLWFAQAQI